LIYDYEKSIILFDLAIKKYVLIDYHINDKNKINDKYLMNV